MGSRCRIVVLSTILLFSLINLGIGCWYVQPILAASGAMGCCYLALRVARLRRTSLGINQSQTSDDSATSSPTVVRPAQREPVDPNDTEALVNQLLEQGRYALLLRPQIANTLDDVRFGRVLDALQDGAALVPEGEVVLGGVDAALDDGHLTPDEIIATQGRVVKVRGLFLDRYPVTNVQYYEFVAAGGYQQMSLWDKGIWPAVLDMVDSTGVPGPKYWQYGCFAPGREQHPVVGVSWYEACAYARWVGKRLPTDAEWVKAGSWPVTLSETNRSQRRYPWGDTMDRRKANLWGSGTDDTVPVQEYADGGSVGGVSQLIGNVWEWTSNNFSPVDPYGNHYQVGNPMKSIRGGAFDTYFDNQATCQFQSGENPLSRRHNIGFRCAVGVCDLLLAQSGRPADVSANVDTPPDASVPSDSKAPSDTAEVQADVAIAPADTTAADITAADAQVSKSEEVPA